MNKIERAIDVATKAHHNQFRKLTNIPYISHPYNVGMILARAGCKEEIICAGILHDTVEDTDVTLEEIQAEFGLYVAELVSGCSEPDKSLSWEERKQHTIDDLKTASKDVCLIVCADKLHNIRSVSKDFKEKGDHVWDNFKRGRKQQEWYYRGILEVLSLQLKAEPLLNEYRKEVEFVFQE